MRGGKMLDGKRVKLLRGALTVGGTEFNAGDAGEFVKCGVVCCTFKRDDGKRLDVSHWNISDFLVETAGEGQP